MENIVIDEEFKGLLPKLDKETLRLLEENILENGCRDSLVLWGDILVDGHNRFAICTEHNIPFNTVNKEFASREDAIIWIITNQISRRNLTQTRLSYYRGLHYRTEKKKKASNQYTSKSAGSQNGTQQKNQKTAQMLADQHNVSRNTILRDEKNADAIDAIGETSPEAKRMILDKEVKIDKRELIAIAGMPKEEIAEIAAQIEDGTYEKKKPDAPEETVFRDPISSDDSGTPGVSGTPGAPGALPPMDPPSTPQPLDTVLRDATYSFYSELRDLTKKGGEPELKKALRSCIDLLEDLLISI